MKNKKILLILPVIILIISNRIAFSPMGVMANSMQDAASQDDAGEEATTETPLPQGTIPPQNTARPT